MASCDVFVYDRQTDTIQRVSLAADGTQGNGDSSYCHDQRRRPLCGVLLCRQQPRPRRYQWRQRHLRHSEPLRVGVWEPRGRVGRRPRRFRNRLRQRLARHQVLCRQRCLAGSTYEYNASGTSIESYSLNTGNTAPRGAASTIAGDKTWVVDANRKVYVYNNSGGLLGSWTAGTLTTKATVEGIATNGTDVWIVDAKSDKVYKYTGAASRLSGSQNAASSFSLNSGNTSPKDIVTDGVNLWVVNDSTTDKVFKYTIAGSLVSSWTITTAGATSPTGITIDPANVSNIWIVDSGTDRVYQYNAAATFANGSSHAADVSFALAAGNTNPQGIADPPAPGSAVATPPGFLRPGSQPRPGPGPGRRRHPQPRQQPDQGRQHCKPRRSQAHGRFHHQPTLGFAPGSFGGPCPSGLDQARSKIRK